MFLVHYGNAINRYIKRIYKWDRNNTMSTELKNPKHKHKVYNKEFAGAASRE